MKKNYIIPSIAVIDCCADTCMLADSLSIKFGGEGKEGQVFTADSNDRDDYDDEDLW